MLDGMGGRVVQGSVPLTSWHKVLGSSCGSVLVSSLSSCSPKTPVLLNLDCKQARVCLCAREWAKIHAHGLMAPPTPTTPNPNQDLADGWKEAECLFSIKGCPDTIFRPGIRASQHICLTLTLKRILVMTQNALSLCPHARRTGPASPRCGMTTVNHVSSSPDDFSTILLEQVCQKGCDVSLWREGLWKT